MKYILRVLVLLGMVFAFAQTTNTLTVTIPSDVATAFAHAHAARYAEIKQRASKLTQPLTEENNPSTPQAAMDAEIATMIADLVLHYSPSDAPSKQANESDTDRRNRYQQQIRSKITVK